MNSTIHLKTVVFHCWYRTTSFTLFEHLDNKFHYFHLKKQFQFYNVCKLSVSPSSIFFFDLTNRSARYSKLSQTYFSIKLMVSIVGSWWNTLLVFQKWNISFGVVSQVCYSWDTRFVIALWADDTIKKRMFYDTLKHNIKRYCWWKIWMKTREKWGLT